ncbi:zinc finger protein 184-like [Tigriopus californicus]|uniref:zinc finger protein 184-like n=1 Tax=Tigriopus californicus TaxID=6832 RepID=UPI0027DA7F28|nr:zinc finger protein 184-like [Tigriopus californicus]
MDLVANLLERLASAGDSLNLLYLVVQNWIIFQKDEFDVFDEEGDPFTTQVFLIEISTGKYIHRAQGRKIDFGTTLDLDILYSKLSESFVEFKVCQGFSPKSQIGNEANLCILEFPYKRRVALNCQSVFKSNEGSNEHEHGVELDKVCCLPCQEVWSNESYWDSLAMNSRKLKAVLEEETELFPPLEEEEHRTEDLVSDFKPNLKSDDDQVNRPLRIQLARQISRKRPVHNEVPPEDDPTKRVYSCNHCAQTFSSPDAYQKHQRKKRKVGCKECKKDIFTFKQLIEHASKAHPKTIEKYLKYGQNSADLKLLKVPKKCSLCDLVLNGNFLLYRHKEIYHELGDFKCATCQEPCLTYYDLVIHNYQEHDQSLKHIQPQTYGLEAVTFPDGKVEYKRVNFACEHCDATYCNDSGWTMHMIANHSWDLFKCKLWEETCHYAHDFSTHVLNFHPYNPEVKCPTPYCFHVSNLKEDPDHFNLHFQECRRPRYDCKSAPQQGMFQCDTCGKKYSSKGSFDAHIKQHQGIERYKCIHCDYGTNIKVVLIDHENKHLREKGLTNADTNLVLYHQCDQCGKEFAHKHSLRNHIKSTHLSIQKIRECKDCGQRFRSQSVLYLHKRRVHGFVNTKPIRGGRRVAKKASKELDFE